MSAYTRSLPTAPRGRRAATAAVRSGGAVTAGAGAGSSAAYGSEVVRLAKTPAPTSAAAVARTPACRRHRVRSAARRTCSSIGVPGSSAGPPPRTSGAATRPGYAAGVSAGWDGAAHSGQHGVQGRGDDVRVDADAPPHPVTHGHLDVRCRSRVPAGRERV